MDALLDEELEAARPQHLGFVRAGGAVALDIVSLPIAVLVASASLFKLVGRTSAKRSVW